MATPPPNFYTIEHDDRVRTAEGKSFTLYSTERTLHRAQLPYSATDFYDTDRGSKMTIQQKINHSPRLYSMMRSTSAGRMNTDRSASNLRLLIGTRERDGPGSCSALAATAPHAEPRRKVGSSAFASAQPRIGKESGLPWRIAEPSYSTLRLDRNVWTMRENRLPKGSTFGSAQRWKRTPPNVLTQPGPGSYGELHSWPECGFMGTSRGFNHLGR